MRQMHSFSDDRQYFKISAHNTGDVGNV